MDGTLAPWAISLRRSVWRLDRIGDHARRIRAAQRTV